MRIGKSQMRVSKSRSSEMRLHLNRVGTERHCNCELFVRLDGYLETRRENKIPIEAETSTGMKRGGTVRPGLTALRCGWAAKRELLLVKNHRRIRWTAATTLTVSRNCQHFAVA